MEYIADFFSLHEHIAVITGGGGVLAGGFADALLKAGAKVSLWGRGSQSIEKRLKELSDMGFEEMLHTAIVDTYSEEQVLKALDKTEKALGIPDILINGVGGNLGKSPFTQTDVGVFESVLKLNIVAGLVVPTKVFGARWIESGVSGSIINIASMSSYIPLSGVWAYDAAKAGVLNLTKACAKEFAPYGIRVNAIAPGFFLGKQNRSLLINDTTGELTERGKAVIEHTPFGRFGQPHELAGALVFLASNRASGFVTGICIPVDGGYLAYNI